MRGIEIAKLVGMSRTLLFVEGLEWLRRGIGWHTCDTPTLTKSTAKSDQQQTDSPSTPALNGGESALAWIGFATTYNAAGTAKIPASCTRQRILWVGLWVGNFRIATKRAASPALVPGNT